MASLENLVTQLLPGVNIDDVLQGLPSPDLATDTLPIAASPTSAPFQPDSSSHAAYSSHDSPHEPMIPEAVPNNADGFNWEEEKKSVDGLTDGMAALSVEPTGVGYLGTIVSRLQ